MSKNPRYPIKNIILPTGEVEVPHIRERVTYENFVDYILTQLDILKDPENIYAVLADKFYGDPNLWTVIADNNPLINDTYLYEGIKIRIPILT